MTAYEQIEALVGAYGTAAFEYGAAHDTRRFREEQALIARTALLAAVTALEEDAERLRNPWIPCSERMPNDTMQCVVSMEGISCWSWWLQDIHKWSIVGMDMTDAIKFWYPLPAPPDAARQSTTSAGAEGKS